MNDHERAFVIMVGVILALLFFTVVGRGLIMIFGSGA